MPARGTRSSRSRLRTGRPTKASAPLPGTRLAWLARPSQPWSAPLLVFALALLVRLSVLAERAKSPTFDAPIIDAARYDELARMIAAGHWPAELFWQSPFYPCFLGLVYALGGGSMLAAKVLQVLLGSATCVLGWRLGAELCDRRVGLGAGVILALYGPLAFFETELLATGWAVFLALAVVLLLYRCARAPKLWWLGALGACSALAVQTHAILLPFVAIGAAWLGWERWRAPARRAQALGALALAGASFALVTAPFLVGSARLTGSIAWLPSSGGVNLYLGNNADSCATVGIRPGRQWIALVQEPARRHGAASPAAESRFFVDEVVAYAKREPLDLAAGLGWKALRLASSREVPRNVDLYVASRWSLLLHALVFKLGPLGVPFGLLLPAALLGLLGGGWRAIRGPGRLLLCVYGLSIVAVLVASRYRLPLVPVLAVLAARGVCNVREWLRAAEWPRLRTAGLTAALGLGLGILPGPFCEERGPFEAEIYFGAGAYRDRQGRQAEAFALYQRALELEPRFYEAHYNVAVLHAQQQRPEQAATHYRAAIEIDPRQADARLGLGVALLDLGRSADALVEVQAAAELEPDRASSHYLLGRLLGAAGRFAEAERALRRGLELRPDDADALNSLAWLLTGEDEPALQRADEAVLLAERAVALAGENDRYSLDTLGTAYLVAGQLGQARVTLGRALELCRSAGDTRLGSAVETRLVRAAAAADGSADLRR
jgi:Tfp pilus assembly protein PilF/4-amino-4-deoxy-L-arabinose transferase-like glycosyltransferase